MNVLSLCSGVGGMDLGLQRAGWEHVGFCESEPYRRDVLRARFPGAPIHDDVSSDDFAAWAGRLGARGGAVGAGRCDGSVDAGGSGIPGASVDLVAGGTPCQDLSVAGRRAGLAGERSGLFFDFARVVDAVRPRWVLWENVPGALSSHGGRDFGVVLGTLADIGYGLAWRILDSRYFGVPQRRRRVFLVGALADGDPRAASVHAGQVLAVGTRCSRHPATRGETRPDAAVASLSGLGTRGPDDNDGQGGRPVSYALNAKRGKRDDGESETFIAFHVTQDPISGDISPATDATVRRLTPTECERLQGFPDGWTDLGGTPDSKRYAALGDAVTVPVAEWIGRRRLLMSSPETGVRLSLMSVPETEETKP